MKFKEYDKPSPHVVIDDFLTPEEYKDVMGEVTDLLPSMTIGKFGPDDGHLNLEHKRTINVWVDEHFINDRSQSKILKHIIKIWGEEAQDFLGSTRSSTFRIYKNTTKDGTLVTVYKNGGYYKDHNDNGPGSFLSASLSMGKNFKGGEFVLEDKVIPFKDNRLIIFEANITHRVNTVISDDNPDNWRYSIQYFATFQ
jgi:hypothetical protein